MMMIFFDLITVDCIYGCLSRQWIKKNDGYQSIVRPENFNWIQN